MRAGRDKRTAGDGDVIRDTGHAGFVRAVGGDGYAGWSVHYVGSYVGPGEYNKQEGLIIMACDSIL